MMLLLQSQSFLTSSSLHISTLPNRENVHLSVFRERKYGTHRASSLSKILCLNVGIDDVADVVHNKVLIAAAVSGAIGQLSKPFTATLFYGKDFNFKTALQAGGFPSTHSSAVVATATCLGLERGFSDAIFGLAVVYAGLIMYDAQGVRREVGIHAKTINKVLIETQINSISSTKDANDFSDKFSRKSSTSPQTSDTVFLKEANTFPTIEKKDSLLLESNPGLVNGIQKRVAFTSSPLKEAVGHTEIEVIAGALLGFFVSLAVCIVV